MRARIFCITFWFGLHLDEYGGKNFSLCEIYILRFGSMVLLWVRNICFAIMGNLFIYSLSIIFLVYFMDFVCVGNSVFLCDANFVAVYFDAID